MADTFESCWRRVLLHAPEVPVFLARQWIQDVYRELGQSRPFVWLTRETHLSVRASRSVAVMATNGSTTLTSAGLFLSTDAGRQLKGTLPIYSIAAFTDVNTITLDKPWAGSTGAATVTILDQYLACPTDFGAFKQIVDTSAMRVIPFWFTQDQLNAMDPHRTSTGDPQRLLVARGVSTITPTLGRMLYEWWPAPTAARTYPALYTIKPEALVDTDQFRGALADRGDVLVEGALVYCARWPGTREKPNPYFNLQLAREHAQVYEAKKRQISLRDDDMEPQDLGTIPWHEYSHWGLAFDTDLLRRSDATVDAYY